MEQPAAPNAGRSNQEFRDSFVAAIYEASPDGILVVDKHDVIVSHNQRLFEVLGVSPAEIPGDHGGSLAGRADQPLLSRVVQKVRDPDGFVRQVKELYANPELDDHREVELKDGRTLERHSSALWGASRHYLGRVWFFRDISARKRAEEALREMSQTDPLTGVANRRHFFLRAGEELSRARRYGRDLSIVMLDLDHFKRVNDRWGHAAGDRVLKMLCVVCMRILRQADLMARVGGEEFAVVVPDTNLDGATLLAERVRLAVADQALAEGGDMIRVTLSAGVSALAPTDSTVDDVLKRADQALYSAKAAGRNRTEQA